MFLDLSPCLLYLRLTLPQLPKRCCLNFIQLHSYCFVLAFNGLLPEVNFSCLSPQLSYTCCLNSHVFRSRQRTKRLRRFMEWLRNDGQFKVILEVCRVGCNSARFTSAIRRRVPFSSIIAAGATPLLHFVIVQFPPVHNYFGPRTKMFWSVPIKFWLLPLEFRITVGHGSALNLGRR